MIPCGSTWPVVMENGYTVKVYPKGSCVPVVSFTVTVKLKLPVTVGVPEIVPLELPIDKPAGNPVAVQVYVPVPPFAKKP